MPKPYPSEFRDDVVRVARNRDDGVSERGARRATAYLSRRRRQEGLGRLTSIEYETIMTPPAAQAA